MKVTGPMFSLTASGTIGGVVTASTWKGRPYFRVKTTPSNPRSQAQTQQRAMMQYLSQEWAGVSDVSKATWTEPASAGNFSPFNAFVKYNLQRWAIGKSPSLDYPAPEVGVVATGLTLLLTAGLKSFEVEFTVTTINNSHAVAIFVSDTEAGAGTKVAFVRGVDFGVGASIKTTFTGYASGIAQWVRCETWTSDGVMSTGGVAEEVIPT